MRNQAWLQDGTLVKDEEFFLDGVVLKITDHIGSTIRKATAEEIEAFNTSNKEARDPLKEIDDLKSRISALEKA